MDLQAAEAWLEGLINVERMPDMRRARLGLGAISALLTRVGAPQRGLPCLHVAGSKGKGSVALFAECLLGGAGVRVGVFTSPHLVRWTERFRIDGVEVDDEALAAVLTRLRPHVDALRDGDDPPSFFDATTAAALMLFSEAGVDVAVLEVGLGGRLDSTNVCEPAATAVTSIELEHTDRLGETQAEIAFEKAGIAKSGVPLVTGPLSDEAREVVEARAAEVGAPLVAWCVDFGVEATERPEAFRWFDGTDALEFELGVLGAHQPVNAAIALSCVKRLPIVDRGRLLSSAAESLANARLPGRVELFGREPLVVIDGAHTAASAGVLAEAVGHLEHSAAHLVLSVSMGKDVETLCRRLGRLAKRVTVTRADPHRSLAPDALAEIVRRVAPAAEVHVVEDPRAAVREAFALLDSTDLFLVAGSVYLAGVAREVLAAA